jgi:DHA1 family bicyclomycin/chloramphenicol resistance-like MFS transporter
LLGSLRVGLLSSALAFNFLGLFLYISSAPAIIYKVLALNEYQFAWLFVPAIGGFIFGAFLSARLAGKLAAQRTILIGYGVMGIAAAVGVIYHALFPVYTIGLSLVMPNLTIYALDLFPHNRGLASSLQVFQGSMFNAIVAGAVAPYVADSGLGLAATNAASKSREVRREKVCFANSPMPPSSRPRSGRI